MGARGRTHPPFGMTPTFQNLSLSTSQIIFSKSRCHTRRRMGAATRTHRSFGMTTTKTLRTVFSLRASVYSIPRVYPCTSELHHGSLHPIPHPLHLGFLFLQLQTWWENYSTSLFPIKNVIRYCLQKISVLDLLKNKLTAMLIVHHILWIWTKEAIH